MCKKVVTAILLAAVAAGSACQAQAQTGWVGSYHRGGHVAASRLMLLANDGDMRAQARLCFMFQAGLGVVQSFAVAATYCRVAAEQGEPNAQYLLGLMYDKGQGVGRDVVLAYMWLDLAAAGGACRLCADKGRRRDKNDSVAASVQPSAGRSPRWDSLTAG
jgi:TPR repeat protein